MTAAAEVPSPSEGLPTKFAGQLLEVEHVLPDFNAIVEEYSDLVKEYDNAIRNAELKHEAHVNLLQTVDRLTTPGIFQKPFEKVQPQKPGPSSPDAGAKSAEPQASYNDRFNSIANEATAPTVSRAEQSHANIVAARQQLPSPPSTDLPTTTTITVGPERKGSEYVGTMYYDYPHRPLLVARHLIYVVVK